MAFSKETQAALDIEVSGTRRDMAYVLQMASLRVVSLIGESEVTFTAEQFTAIRSALMHEVMDVFAYYAGSALASKVIPQEKMPNRKRKTN